MHSHFTLYLYVHNEMRDSFVILYLIHLYTVYKTYATFPAKIFINPKRKQIQILIFCFVTGTVTRLKSFATQDHYQTKTQKANTC